MNSNHSFNDWAVDCALPLHIISTLNDLHVKLECLEENISWDENLLK